MEIFMSHAPRKPNKEKNNQNQRNTVGIRRMSSDVQSNDPLSEDILSHSVNRVCGPRWPVFAVRLSFTLYT